MNVTAPLFVWGSVGQQAFIALFMTLSPCVWSTEDESRCVLVGALPLAGGLKMQSLSSVGPLLLVARIDWGQGAIALATAGGHFSPAAVASA